MGYAGSDLNLSGATLTAAQFNNVGDANGAIKFGSIVPVSEEDVSWCIEVQYLNNDGSTDIENIYTWDGTMWLDVNYDDATDVVIPAGKGLWTYNSTGGSVVNFRSAGEVGSKDIVCPLNLSGATAVANGFPCAITFGDLVALSEDDVSWSIEIQYLNNDGSTDIENIYTWDGTMWLDVNYDDATDIEIPAGKGMWIYNSTGGSAVSIQIPAPEL